MAIRYGKGLIGGAVVVALLALLVHWIGINTIELYRDDLLFYLQAHLILVLVSMLAALIVGIPAGILLSRPNMVGRAERFMQIFNIGNTVPPLAVLAIALGVLGLGSGPAIFALFLASLLPIVRNTYEGLKNVQGSLKEAATGIGMTPRQVLFRVELPNAVPIIIGGARVALAINVGTAPLAFLMSWTTMRRHRWIDIAIMIPFMTPPYVASLAWLDFTRVNGLAEQLFGPVGTFIASIIAPIVAYSRIF